jgi:hypothetical protein
MALICGRQRLRGTADVQKPVTEVPERQILRCAVIFEQEDDDEKEPSISGGKALLVWLSGQALRLENTCSTAIRIKCARRGVFPANQDSI